MKSKMKFMIAALVMITIILYPGSKANAEAEKHTATVTTDYSETEKDRQLDLAFQKVIASEQQCAVAEIVVSSSRIIYTDIKVEYTVEYKNGKTATKTASFTFDSSDAKFEVDHYVRTSIMEKDNSIKEILEVKDLSRKVTHEVVYTFWTESVNDSICKLYGVPYTERDMVAELSPLTVYIQGYRMPYVLEDGGELYFKNDYVDSPVFNNTVPKGNIDYALDDSYQYRNYRFDSTVKAGEKIDRIATPYRKSAYELLERYTIRGQDYNSLTNILYFLNGGDWRDGKISYDKASNTLYYGRKPTKKEQSLAKDTIFAFAEKATKGCKTDKEKVAAIHDAIIKTVQYKSDALFYDHMTGRDYEDGVWNIDNAAQVIKSKKGNDEALALLFQECLNRLFISCDIVAGKYIWPEDGIWNRVYIASKPYYVDVTRDLKATKNKNKIYNKYLLKSGDFFMGTHRWYDPDYTLELFRKDWKSIDTNNIKTTQELRRAVVYASYKCGEYNHKTYTFKIKSSKVQTDCAQYVMSYRFVKLAQQEYKNGILTVTFN